MIDLKGYLPDVVKGIREFDEICNAANPEFRLLYECVNKVFDNQFISNAGVEGIKRYENIVGIKANVSDSLDIRRADVLSKWDNELPYTYKRLVVRLNNLIGNDKYLLNLEPDKYFLDLKVIDEDYKVMRVIHDMLKEMIPANILIVFAGSLVVVFEVKIKYENTLRMVSDFYPRYNLKPLFLDGSWFLSGKYFLAVYDSDTMIDFYPTVFGIAASVDIPIDIVNTLRISADCENGIDVNAGLNICGYIDLEHYINANLNVKGNINVGVGTDAGLTVEKDLWFLDGNMLLDGSRIIDAEIYKEEV